MLIHTDQGLLKEKTIYLGHEVVGQVIAKGKNVKKITLGDRVILDSVIRNEKQSKAKNVFGAFSNYFVRGQDRLQVISKKLKGSKAPTKILGELNRSSTILRDLLDAKFNNIVVNNKEIAQELKDYLARISPEQE